MGRRGPPRRAAALKRAEGTYHHTRDAAQQMPLADALLEAPEHVKKNKQAFDDWQKLVVILKRVGLLTEPSAAMLAQFVMLNAAIIKTWSSGRTPKMHDLNMFMRMNNELGFSPGRPLKPVKPGSSSTPPETPTANPFTQFNKFKRDPE